VRGRCGEHARENPGGIGVQCDSAQTNKMNARSGNLLIVEAVQVYSECRRLNVHGLQLASRQSAKWTATGSSIVALFSDSGSRVGILSMFRASPRPPPLRDTFQRAFQRRGPRADRTVRYPSECRLNQRPSRRGVYSRSAELRWDYYHLTDGERCMSSYATPEIIPPSIPLRLTLINLIV